jgi:hypothetical protein
MKWIVVVACERASKSAETGRVDWNRKRIGVDHGHGVGAIRWRPVSCCAVDRNLLYAIRTQAMISRRENHRVGVGRGRDDDWIIGDIAVGVYGYAIETT